MGYELESVASHQPTPSTPAAPAREEKVVSMYSGDDARIARALSKLTGKSESINTPSINESVTAEPVNSAASLPLSPQLAALARKEQKFRQEQQALKAKELALDAERKEIAELKALKAKLAAGDYSEIDKVVDYEKLVQHKIGRDQKTEEMESLRNDIAALKAAQEKDVNERFESAVNQRRSAIKSLVAENPDFSTVKELKAEEVVVQLILDTWEEDEVELTPEEAAMAVEKELLERSKKWTSLTKLKSQEAPAEKRELPPLKPAMKTLTNNMASTGEVKKPLKPLHLMTDQERYQEAYRRAQEKFQNRG